VKRAESSSSRALFAIWLLALAPTLLLALLVLVALAVALGSDANRSSMVLELLRITIAWPMVALALAIVFGLTFRHEIAGSMSRVAVRFAGVEITTQAQKQPAGAEASSLPAPTEADVGAGPVIAEAAVPARSADQEKSQVETEAKAKGVVVEVPTVSQNEVADALEKVKALSAWRMRMWWFWWLQNARRALAPLTVEVLRWLAGQPGGTASYASYEQRWKRDILPPEMVQTELTAILDILVQFDMIDSPASREWLTLKDVGRKFLDYVDNRWNPFVDPTIT
jgi:hypothetical protein